VAAAANGHPQRLDKKLYERELYRLQAELVKMQAWVSDQAPG
jgi:polyphosphate kinase 2 (PPK2 family)